jgi:O-antigen/teichoic acid export membrane protein
MTLQAIERVPLSQFLQWLPLMLRLLALPLCLLSSMETLLQAFVLTQLLGTALGLFAAWSITRRFVDLGRRPRRPTADEIRSGAAYAALSLIALNSVEVDKIGAVHSVGPHGAGIYASASRIVSAGTLPLIGLLMAAQPRLFRHAQGSKAELRRLVFAILAACAVYSALAMLALNLGTALLIRLFGSAFAQLSGLLPLMSVIIPLQGMRLAAANIMVALGKPSRRIGFDAAGITLLIGLMVWLGPRYGPEGLAVSVAMTEGTLALVGWFIVLRHLSAELSPDRDPTAP